MEGYCIPATRATARLVEKKSEFIAALAPVQTEQEATDFLEEVRAAHRTASHNVYAYVLRQEGRTRYSDDGEPAKTAGLPVLGAIQHAGLVDCAIVVTRYFGGTLLGTGGLVRAYSAAAAAAVKEAGVLQMRALRRLALRLEYAQYEPVCRLLAERGAQLEGEAAFGVDVRLAALVPAEGAESLAHALHELLRGGDGVEMGGVLFAPFAAG